MIDGDGSLGFTAKNIPFVSIVTQSEYIASYYTSFVKEHTGLVKTTSRNKRDGVFNICVVREGAQSMASLLYYDSSISLNRKAGKALQISRWIRPPGMKIREPAKRWDTAQDLFIRTHSLKESSAHLGRSTSSISTRLCRLKKQEDLSL